MEQPVSPERTGWRDEALSQRHRLWGWDCPAVDIDFLMLEFNLGIPVALVEYKQLNARMPDLTHPSYRAMALLANRPPAIPFFISFYDNQKWWFRVTPVNAAAKQIFKPNQLMTEREYVTNLYTMRNKVISQMVLQNLRTFKPSY